MSSSDTGGLKTLSNPTVFRFHTEKLRLLAYIFFWSMCIFAIIITKFTVAPTMGPCPLNEGDPPTYGMHCSDLMQLFGFNNICVNWDYSPSREVIGLYFPLFEYSTILYVVVEYLQTRNDFENNMVAPVIYKISNILFPIKIVLFAWFRMIFVCSVTQDPIPMFGTEMPATTAHTLGFQGLQVALVLLVFENILQIYYKERSVFGMSPKLTQTMSIIYLIALTIVTALKISWAQSIFITGTPWIDQPWPYIFDIAWLILAAVLPPFFAIDAMRNETPMTVSVSNQRKITSGGKKESDAFL